MKRYPVLNVVQRGRDYYLEQERFYLYDLKYNDEEEKTLWFIPVVIMNSRGEFQNFSFNSTLSPPIQDYGQWFKVNYGQWGIYRVNYLPHQWKSLIIAIQNNDPLLTWKDRLGLVDDVFALAFSGKISIRFALDLAKSLKNEKSYAVWRVLLKRLRFISDRIYKRPFFVVQNFNRFVRELLKEPILRLRNDTISEKKLLPIIYEAAAYFENFEIIQEAKNRYQLFESINFCSKSYLCFKR